MCSCHSQTAAAAFVKAGVPHVVAVRSRALLLDSAAVCFTRHFYLSLCSGKPVEAAFEVAQAAVCAMPDRLTPHSTGTTSARESAKFVLMGHGDHAEILFGPGVLPPGELRDRSKPLCASNLPALSEIFVGRQQLMQQAVVALCGARRRCIYLVGAGGIGVCGGGK